MGKYHRYTEEEKEFLKNNVKGRTNKELTDLFNERFDEDLLVSQIANFKTSRGLKSGLDNKFSNGHTPWNTGLKGFRKGHKSGFKKGNTPWHTREVGSERIDRDGYLEVKVADPNEWKYRHHLVWVENNGPIPEGYVVIFADQNKSNFNIDNLLLISRSQLAILNRRGLIQKDAELTRTGIIIADICKKASDRRKGRKRNERDTF